MNKMAGAQGPDPKVITSLLPLPPTHFVHFRIRLFLALHGGLGKGLGVEISELNKVCSPVPSIQGNIFKQFGLYSKKCRSEWLQNVEKLLEKRMGTHRE